MGKTSIFLGDSLPAFSSTARFRDAFGGAGAKMREFGHRGRRERCLQSLPSGEWLGGERLMNSEGILLLVLMKNSMDSIIDICILICVLLTISMVLV